MLNEFRKAYPKGSLISELLNIYQGKYIVRVLAIVDEVTLATGLAAEDTLEMAEDRARLRALGAMNIEPTLNYGANGPVYSNEALPGGSGIGSPGTNPPSPSMSRSFPGLGDRSSADFPISESAGLPTDDYARSSGMTASEDEWLSSPPAQSPDRDPPAQEAIGSWAAPPKSFESLETDPVFSPASTMTASEVPTAAAPATAPEFESPLVSATPEIQTFAAGTPPSETTLLNADERKQKIAQTTLEIKRLNWSTQQGRDFLEQQYNKRARSQLSDEQLLDFLHYLKAQPNPS